MNNARPVFLILGLFHFLNLHLSADLVKFPVGPAAWTVDLSDSQINKASQVGGVNMVKIEVTQNDQYRCSLISFSNGLSRSSWDIPGSIVIITEDPNGNPFVTYPSKFFSIPFLSPAFAWLSPQSLQEKTPVSYKGKSCFHYKAKITVPSLNSGPPTGQNFEAWIDCKTLLPVALDNGNQLASYAFLPPPKTPLVLPPKYAAVLDYSSMSQGMPRLHHTQ